jgi:hypothetical protein
MKKFFYLMLLCVVTIGLVSCEKDDEVFSENQIVGTWATTQGFVGGEWLDIPTNSDMYATMTFYEDGDYYGDSELFGSGWGTYTLSGKTLKTYLNGELFYVYTIKSLTDTFAEVTMAYQNSNIGLRLKKIRE